ncbi:UNVERIFIED_CONTAM: hypothetical protein FKN15_026176, partial [Acipenser sinensis]
CRTRMYTNHWAVRISGASQDADRIADKYGYSNMGQIGDLKDYYHFFHRRTIKRSTLSSRGTHNFISMEPEHCNDDTHNCHSDMNIVGAWKRGYTGKNVVVTILDDGIERNHPDLIENYDSQASFDVNGNDYDPMPRYDASNENKTQNSHRFDTVLRYDCSDTEYSFPCPSTQQPPRTDKLHVLNTRHLALIYNNYQGRKGRGSIFVWASGNGGRSRDHCSCDGYTNSIYTISISSTAESGKKPWYLEECSSTLTTTYSSGESYDRKIITTDLRQRCTDSHTGTSASAPMAAGIIALALEAKEGQTHTHKHNTTEKNKPTLTNTTHSHAEQDKPTLTNTTHSRAEKDKPTLTNTTPTEEDKPTFTNTTHRERQTHTHKHNTHTQKDKPTLTNTTHRERQTHTHKHNTFTRRARQTHTHKHNTQRKTNPHSQTQHRQSKTTPHSQTQHIHTQRKTNSHSQTQHPQRKTNPHSQTQHTERDKPTLTNTTPTEQDNPTLTNTTPTEEDKPTLTNTTPTEQDNPTLTNTTPTEEDKPTLTNTTHTHRKTNPHSQTQHTEKTNPHSQTQHPQRKTTPHSQTQHPQRKTNPHSQTQHPQRKTTPHSQTQHTEKDKPTLTNTTPTEEDKPTLTNTTPTEKDKPTHSQTQHTEKDKPTLTNTTHTEKDKPTLKHNTHTEDKPTLTNTTHIHTQRKTNSHSQTQHTQKKTNPHSQTQHTQRKTNPHSQTQHIHMQRQTHTHKHNTDRERQPHTHKHNTFTHRERQTHTHKHNTDRERQPHTHKHNTFTHRERQTHTHKHNTDRERQPHTHKHNTFTHRERQTHTHKHNTDRERQPHTHKHNTFTHRERQTHTHKHNTDRERARQTHKHNTFTRRERQTHTLKHNTTEKNKPTLTNTTHSHTEKDKPTLTNTTPTEKDKPTLTNTTPTEKDKPTLTNTTPTEKDKPTLTNTTPTEKDKPTLTNTTPTEKDKPTLTNTTPTEKDKPTLTNTTHRERQPHTHKHNTFTRRERQTHTHKHNTQRKTNPHSQTQHTHRKTNPHSNTTHTEKINPHSQTQHTYTHRERQTHTHKHNTHTQKDKGKINNYRCKTLTYGNNTFNSLYGNGGRITVSHLYGFGLMDAEAMVQEAERWKAVPTQHICVESADRQIRTIRPENVVRSVYKAPGCADNSNHHVIYLEHVVVRITITHHRRGDLSIYLTSPSGTKSQLLANRRDIPFTIGAMVREGGFNVKADKIKKKNVASQLRAKPEKAWIDALVAGKLKEWSLVLYGTSVHPYSPRFAPPKVEKPRSPVETTTPDYSEYTGPCDPECSDGGCDGPGPHQCIDCLHYFLKFKNHTRTCVSECPSGFFRDDKKRCKKCYSLCDTCVGSRSDQCTSCKPGYHLNEETYSCVSSCPESFYLDKGNLQGSKCLITCDAGTYYNAHRKECEICHKACAACAGTGAEACTKCAEDYYMEDWRCVLSCSAGYYLEQSSENGEKLSTCRKCDASCLTCTGSGEKNCTSCISGYNLESGVCVVGTICKDGEYIDDSGKCHLCDATCYKCTGPDKNQCLSCTPTRYFDDGHCIIVCSMGKFQLNGQCHLCHHTCKQCSGGEPYNCTACDKDKFGNNRYLFQGECKEVCPQGYYPSAEQICQQCPDNCEACERANECLKCSSGYYPSDGECIKLNCEEGEVEDPEYEECMECEKGCKKCMLSNMYLQVLLSFRFKTRCFEGCPEKTYNDDKAMECRECHKNCVSCDENQCYWCEEGWFFSECNNHFFLHLEICVDKCPVDFYEDSQSQTCSRCHSDCAECDGPDPDDCVSCADSSAVLYGGQCFQECPDGTYHDMDTGDCQEECIVRSQFILKQMEYTDKPALFITSSILIVLALGGGVFFFLRSRSKAQPKEKSGYEKLANSSKPISSFDPKRVSVGSSYRQEHGIEYSDRVEKEEEEEEDEDEDIVYMGQDGTVYRKFKYGLLEDDDDEELEYDDESYSFR